MAATAGHPRAVRLLLDEMHAPAAAVALQERGHDVRAVAGTPWLRGSTDEEILRYASVESLAVVTENIAEFAPLAATWAVEGRNHSGLVFTNPRRFNRALGAYLGNLVTALDQLLRAPPDLSGSGTWWL